jgi:pimeloyl-ACP methyl ester carboxylesterase
VALIRADVRFDVTAALPPDAVSDPVHSAATVVADPDQLGVAPFVVVAIPGGTYHRRYWDLQPPGRSGYSQAQWVAERGGVFVACDYLGGGDSSRPEDGDFMTLEVCADAGHELLEQLRVGLAKGSLVDGLPALTDPVFLGIGQSLGGFITMIQQGKYADYPGIAVLGASPLVNANIPFHRELDGLSESERRQAVLEDNAKSAGVDELPAYHGAPRELYRGIFHVLDVPEDLFQYDVEQCSTPINRITGVDGMTPGYAKPFADRITSPVFLAFGDSDVSQQPLLEPTGYPAARDVTVVVIPQMAHMHNFADTREDLWKRLDQWMAVLR